MVVSCATSSHQVATLDWTNCSINSSVPKGAPRWRHPSHVTCTPAPSNVSIAAAYLEGLNRRSDFWALQWWPYPGPWLTRLSYHWRTGVSFPPAAASSTYQPCFAPGTATFLMSGRTPSAYTGMARGSPWVVPSHDSKHSPSTNRRDGWR